MKFNPLMSMEYYGVKIPFKNLSMGWQVLFFVCFVLFCCCCFLSNGNNLPWRMQCITLSQLAYNGTDSEVKHRVMTKICSQCSLAVVFHLSNYTSFKWMCISCNSAEGMAKSKVRAHRDSANVVSTSSKPECNMLTATSKTYNLQAFRSAWRSTGSPGH